jgi:hypothetical protein
MSTVTSHLTTLISLNANSPTCISPPEVLLWHVCLITLTCILHLLLSAHSIRLRLAHNVLYRYYSPPTVQLISWIISIFINVSATLISAHVISAPSTIDYENTQDPSNPFPHIALLWFARPLATPALIWLSLIALDEYGVHVVETTFLDTISSLASCYLFGAVAAATNTHPGNMPAAARVARAGSAFGLLCMLFTPAVLFMDYMCLRGKDLVTHTQWVSLGRGFALQGVRWAACWMVWAGLLQASPGAFCPGRGQLKKVVVVWGFATSIDYLWRGFAMYNEERGEVRGNGQEGRGNDSGEVV